ncbi:hypothetical protein Hte_000602 [Hypoxylon texense]
MDTTDSVTLVGRGHALGRRVKTWVKGKLGLLKSKQVEVAEDDSSEAEVAPLLSSEPGVSAVEALPAGEESVADEEAALAADLESAAGFDDLFESIVEMLGPAAPREPVRAEGIWEDVRVEFSPAPCRRPSEPTPYPFSMDMLVPPERKAEIPMPTHGKVHASYLDEEFRPMPSIREESEEEVAAF